MKNQIMILSLVLAFLFAHEGAASSLRAISPEAANKYVGIAQNCRADVVSKKTGQLLSVIADNRFMLLQLDLERTFLITEKTKGTEGVEVLLRHIKDVNIAYEVVLAQKNDSELDCHKTAHCRTFNARFRLSEENTSTTKTVKTVLEEVDVLVQDTCATLGDKRFFYTKPWYKKLLKGVLRH